MSYYRLQNLSYYRPLGGRPGNLTSGIFLPILLCVKYTNLMLSIPLRFQGFFIAAALSKQYAVFTNISETIFFIGAPCILKSI